MASRDRSFPSDGAFGLRRLRIPVFLVTCEHGGNRIPEPFRRLFHGQEEVLESHRGWDPGALPLARVLAKTLGASLYFSRTSRLLVDLNRSENHPHLFSMPVRTLEKREKLRILNDWYRPYREKVFEAVRHGIESRALVVHLAVHTFTPMLDGKARRVEVGLLYDPSRIGEKTYCDKIRRGLREALGTESPPVSVRANRPYLGKSDGFPTTLRGLYPSESYLGIELEVSQGLIAGGGARWQRVRRALLSVFRITSPM